MAKKRRTQKVPEKKSNKNLVYAALGLIAVIALIVAFSSGNGEPAGQDENLPTEAKYEPLTKPSTYEPGKVKITEFLKFNCGHCYSLSQAMPGLENKYGDKIEITYVPMLWTNLPQDHDLKKSIEAYILANDSGKGEEMKDALFKAVIVEGKDVSSLIFLEDIGRSIGLGDDFVTALKNGDAKDRADANIKLGENFQVDETPTVIINGNLKITPSMTGGTIPQMVNNMDVIIDSLLNQ